MVHVSMRSTLITSRNRRGASVTFPARKRHVVRITSRLLRCLPTRSWIRNRWNRRTAVPVVSCPPETGPTCQRPKWGSSARRGGPFTSFRRTASGNGTDITALVGRKERQKKRGDCEEGMAMLSCSPAAMKKADLACERQRLRR